MTVDVKMAETPDSVSTSLIGELNRIDLLIQNHARLAILENRERSAYKGLFISDNEVENLLNRPIGLPTWKPNEGRREKVNNYERIISLASYKDDGSRIPGSDKLHSLASIFDLTELDLDAILLALAPELDLKYEKIYAYLQDDIARRHPSIDLILNLLCDTFDQKLEARTRFSNSAPLLRHHLIGFVDDPHLPHPPLLRKSLKVDPQIVKYLLGENGIDERLKSLVSLEMPQLHLDDLILPNDLKTKLLNLISQPEILSSGVTIHLMGPYGVGKMSTASAISHGFGKSILRVDTNSLIKSETQTFDGFLRLINREALLNDAVAYWENFDCLLAEDAYTFLSAFLFFLDEQTATVFISGKKSWEPRARHKSPFISLKIPLPDYDARLSLWDRALNGHHLSETGFDIAALCGKFTLSGGQIKDIVASAKNRTLADGSDNSAIDLKTLYSACRAHSNQKLAELARKINPKFAWGDIILPQDKLDRLNEIISHLKYRQKVYVDWGFGEKISLGKGLPVLFSGPSGTGKTMAAEIIARELGLDIYKIDLSLIVSKYIGETEKNLSKIFAEAETSNAILFFDEADALFGKRSEVRDSHDRYANIEIAYLLQKMEEYEGITILATNLRKNLDDAFVRRIKFIIEFPAPDESHRFLIWNGHLPDQAPLGDDLDVEFLARQFKLTGGNIKNAVLHAAFLSASEQCVINMKNLIRGIQREYQKAGKVCVEGDFKRYFGFLSGTS